MAVYKGDYKLDKPHAVALGSFDGLHAGHRALLRLCAQTAQEMGILSAVCTFDTHPRSILGSVKLITDTDEKIRRMQSMGLDDICIEHFDKAYADMSAEAFFDGVLMSKLQAKAILCGENYRFGARGEGDAALLKALCEEHGVKLEVAPYVMHGGQPVSSSMIRKLIENGEAETASLLMDEPFSLTAEVVRGKHLGTKLSLPTINLNIPDDSVVPRYGVYAARVHFDAKCFYGAANIGVRPTVGGGRTNAEINIFDFSGDLYGKTVRVELCKFIRPEKQFKSLDELKLQIIRDKSKIVKYFQK